MHKFDINLLQGISKTAFTHFEFKRLGGLTNVNYLVTIDNHKYFYKFNNQIFNDILFNRNCEELILSKVTTHPQVYFYDQRTIIREYIEGVSPIKADSFNDAIIQNLNMKLNEIHQIDYSKISQVTLLEKIFRVEYLDSLTDKIKGSHFDKNKKEVLNGMLTFIKKYSKHYLDHIGRFRQYNTLCHNDLTLENILKKEDSDDIFLIDFDYSQPNPIFYEFANLFLEIETEFYHNEPYFLMKNETAHSRNLKMRITNNYLNNFYGEKIDKAQFFKMCKQFEVYSFIYWMFICIESFQFNVPNSTGETIDFDFYALYISRFEKLKELMSGYNFEETFGFNLK